LSEVQEYGYKVEYGLNFDCEIRLDGLESTTVNAGTFDIYAEVKQTFDATKVKWITGAETYNNKLLQKQGYDYAKVYYATFDSYGYQGLPWQTIAQIVYLDRI